jgi:3-hydroxyisobutyrate dehydrogenase
MMTVAFLGLGAMGYPMAGHLAGTFQTTVWNRTAAVAEQHAAEFGSAVAASPVEAAQADAIFSCLPTSAVVDEIIAECLPHVKPGAVWVDCTSGHPEAARAAEARLAERGVGWLDAPVSGGPPRAKTGQLTVMVGGESATLAKAAPAIETFAGKVVHVGDAGAGFAVKAVNNMMMAINLWGACEGLLGLQAQGVDVETALSVINTSSGASNVTEEVIAGPLTTGEFPLRFKLALLHKDARIAVDVLDGGIPIPLSSMVTQLLGMARGVLSPDADFREVARALREWTASGRPPER